MTTSTILSDNGATSGSSGLKTTGGNDGTLVIQTTTAGGTATTAITVSATQVVTLANALPVASGGTGQTTYTDGQLLIGNSTGNTLTKATLTGTSNQVTVTNGGGTITLATPQSIGTTSSVQFGSFGVGTAASGTSGEIRATNNVTAYYSSDIKFKENVQPITGACEIVKAIGAKYFDWNAAYLLAHGGADGYFVRKEDFGVIAQDVEKVFPRAVRTRQDGSLAVDYEKLGVLAFPALVELMERINALEKFKQEIENGA